jgi:hypothetical protein
MPTMFSVLGSPLELTNSPALHEPEMLPNTTVNSGIRAYVSKSTKSAQQKVHKVDR